MLKAQLLLVACVDGTPCGEQPDYDANGDLLDEQMRGDNELQIHPPHMAATGPMGPTSLSRVHNGPGPSHDMGSRGTQRRRTGTSRDRWIHNSPNQPWWEHWMDDDHANWGRGGYQEPFPDRASVFWALVGSRRPLTLMEQALTSARPTSASFVSNGPPRRSAAQLQRLRGHLTTAEQQLSPTGTQVNPYPTVEARVLWREITPPKTTNQPAALLTDTRPIGLVPATSAWFHAEHGVRWTPPHPECHLRAGIPREQSECHRQ
jgi:hypothetical protein